MKKKYTWIEFDHDINALVKKISADPDIVITSVYGIPRGGVIPAVYLSHLLGVPLYQKHQITPSTLVVDDIADSGATLIKLVADLKKKKMHEPYTYTIFFKKDSEFKPSFFSKKTSNWIIFPWETVNSSKYDT